MTTGLTAKIRIVRCPKCRLLLPEPPGIAVYKCGGCDAVLQAKKRKDDVNSVVPGQQNKDCAQANELRHTSEDKEHSTSSHDTILPSTNGCFLDQSNESEQNNDSKGSGGDQDESQGRDTGNSGLVNQIGLEIESAHLENEGPVVITGDVPKVEVKDDSSLVEEENLEAGVGNGIASNSESSAAINIRATSAGHGPEEEGISSETHQFSPPTQLEQPKKSFHHDFEHRSSVDSLESTKLVEDVSPEIHVLSPESMKSVEEVSPEIHVRSPQNSIHIVFDVLNPSSELSDTLPGMSKSATRNSLAYDGSESSYDGTDDRFLPHHVHSSKNDQKVSNFVISEETLRRERFSGRNTMSGESENECQGTSSWSGLSDYKHYAMKSSKQERDYMLEQTKHDRQIENRTRFVRDEYPARFPTPGRGYLGGYESGSTSNPVVDEFYRHSSFHSSDRLLDTEQDKMKLLRMVYELEDQLTKTCHLNGKANGRHSRRLNQHGTSPPDETWHDLYHSEQLGRYHQPGTSGPQMDRSCLHCHPRDCHHQMQLLPPPIWNNQGLSRVPHGHNPYNPYNSYSSCPLIPQHYRDSHFPSDNQRLKNQEVKRYYLREKHNSVKRHFRPIAGGAPFITCYNCSRPLQLPVDFLLLKRGRRHRLRCGACSEVLEFSLQSRSHIAPHNTSTSIDPPPSEIDVSCLEDCGLSYCKSCSTEGDPSSQPIFPSPQDVVDNRNISSDSFDPTGEREEIGLKQSQNKYKNPARPSSSKSKSKILSSGKELPQASSSPLHRLMGYSSPNAMISGSVSVPSETTIHKSS